MDDTSRRVEESDGLDADARRRTRQLRAEIDETREELSETVDAIQEKLRPANIVASATEKVKRATTERVRDMAYSAGETTRGVVAQTRRTADDVMDQVRRRPMSAALIGLGAAWLVTNAARRGRKRFSEYDTRTTWDDSWTHDYEEGGYGLLERLRDNPIPAALCGIGLTWLATSGSAQWPQRGYRGAYGRDESWREDPSTIGDTARRVGEKAQEYASETTAAVSRTTRRAQSQFQRLLNENPLMVGAGALVLGAAIGLSLPESERENEWMGETRDNLLERAQDAARSAVSTVQDATGNMAGEVVKRVISGEQA